MYQEKMEVLINIIKDIFGSDDIAPETVLGVIEGVDSLTLVQLMVEAEATFGIEFQDGDVHKSLSVKEVLDVIDSRRK